MNEYTCYESLTESAVFVTGGASGIGAAIVRAFVAQGARVGFVDVDVGAATELLTDLGPEGEVWFRQVDVSDVELLKSTIQQFAETCGGLDVLINNVANDNRHSVEDVTQASWRNTMAVNLDATFFACQTALSLMQKQNSGSIINFSSINAILGPGNMPGYVTAKAGVLGLTKALAQDFGKFNIRVNAITPGWIATERQLSTWLTPQAEALWQEDVALPGRIEPLEVAKLTLFLAADDSRMITGQSIVIDAGRT